MTAVILTIHVLIVLGLIGVVLLQRSEGGALGMGGGGSGGGFMTGRGAANALTRTTSMLAALFFATSLGLAVIAGQGEKTEDVIEGLTGQPVLDLDEAPAGVSADDLLRTLGADDAVDSEGAAPDSEDAAAAEELPLTEQDILDSLGTDPAPAASETPVQDAPSEDAPEAPNN